MGPGGASTQEIKGQMKKKEDEPTTDVEAKEQGSS